MEEENLEITYMISEGRVTIECSMEAFEELKAAVLSRIKTREYQRRYKQKEERKSKAGTPRKKDLKLVQID